VRAFLLGAGVLAGLISWAAGEGLREAIRPPLSEVKLRGSTRMMASRHDQAVAEYRNGAVAFAVLGSVLGAVFGAAGGLARRDPRAAAKAGLLGLTLGAASTIGVSMLILPPYSAYRELHPDESLQDLLRPMLVHLGPWATAGAAGGLAFAIGLAARGRIGAVVLGGFLGAAIGTVSYDIVGAFAFPLAGTARYLSLTAGTRLLARMAVTLSAAAGVAIGLIEERSSAGG
jgi:hypothetical protein